MSPELYLQLPFICLHWLENFHAVRTGQREPEPICRIFLTSALQLVSSILKRTLEMLCFDLELPWQGHYKPRAPCRNLHGCTFFLVS